MLCNVSLFCSPVAFPSFRIRLNCLLLSSTFKKFYYLKKICAYAKFHCAIGILKQIESIV